MRTWKINRVAVTERVEALNGNKKTYEHNGVTRLIKKSSADPAIGLARIEAADNITKLEKLAAKKKFGNTNDLMTFCVNQYLESI